MITRGRLISVLPALVIVVGSMFIISKQQGELSASKLSLRIALTAACVDRDQFYQALERMELPRSNRDIMKVNDPVLLWHMIKEQVIKRCDEPARLLSIAS